jgi:hypothetical protein
LLGQCAISLKGKESNKSSKKKKGVLHSLQC